MTPPDQERMVPGEANEDLYAEHVVRYQFALNLVQAKSVLDCACGVGYGSALLAQQATWVLGVDNAPPAIARARAKYPATNLRYALGDAHSLPLRDCAVDVVVSFETIEHLAEPERFVHEARRVLNDQGLFLVSTPNTAVYRTEDGVVNPFHLHEFKVGDFLDLLTSYFPSVQLLAQRQQSAMILGPSGPSLMRAWFADEREPVADILERSPYVLAVCGREPVDAVGVVRFESGGSRFHEVVSWARSLEGDVSAARAHVERLQSELDDRTAWALSLEHDALMAREHAKQSHAELEQRTGWALSMQAELARARARVTESEQEFAERTGWALSLQAELERAHARITSLEQEFAERTGWALSLQAELERAHARITSLEQDFAERTGWALSLHAELERAHARITSLEQELVERTTWAQALDRELQEERAAAAALRFQLERQTLSLIHI